MDQWDCIETSAGYVQYVHKTSGRISQLDPDLDTVMERIASESNSIRYTTYRVADKLSKISAELFMDCVPYQTVISVLERHCLQHTDSAPLVRPDQLTSVLHDIFYAADKAGLFEARSGFVLERYVRMVANFLWNIFDRDRSTPLSVLELKQTFILICKPSTYDRIIFEHFLLAADHNACISRYRFESLVLVMAKIFAHVDPTPVCMSTTTSSTSAKPFFVQPITSLLDDCFAQCPGLVGVNKFQFYTLWRRPPSGSISFGHFANVQALIGRMFQSRTVEHDQRICVNCAISPIRGLCFRCQQCRKVTLCFKCFGIGYVAGKHCPEHRMYEQSAQEMDHAELNRIRVFVRKIWHLLNGKSFTKHSCDVKQPQNITIETNVIEIDDNDLHKQSRSELIDSNIVENDRNNLANLQQQSEIAMSGQSLSPKGISTWNSTDGSPLAEVENLQSTIELLSEQSSLFADWLNAHKALPLDITFLNKHQLTLQSLVCQLQKYQHHHRTFSSIRPHSCSTPYTHKNNKHLVGSGSLMLSTCEASKSIKGNDINRSYLEANRSDISMGDLSTWFHTKRSTETMRAKRASLHTVSEVENTNMSAFQDLLNAVKEILEDSYSDNAELTKVTSQLERVLGHMVDDVASKHSKSIDTYVLNEFRISSGYVPFCDNQSKLTKF